MDFTGEQQTVTLDQSGSGLLKFVSPLVFSGYGHPKTIVLTGSTAGSGEIAGNIANPHDRKGAATTSLTKMGTGVWTLSGMNTYTGPTTVAKGILSVASAGSLGPKTDVIVEKGAMLDLNFHGRMKVRGLSLGGQIQPPGEYTRRSVSQVYPRGRDTERPTMTDLKVTRSENISLWKKEIADEKTDVVLGSVAAVRCCAGR